MKSYLSDSVLKTAKIAKQIAKTCKKGDIVLLFGDLGAGKTVFAKGFVSYFSKAQVVSPTFTIVNTYKGDINIYHFDLYRINSVEELEEIGFEEYLYSDGICLIEWPERAKELLPRNLIKVSIIKKGDNQREIIVEKN